MPKSSKRIALVVSDFNDEITGRMEAVAIQTAKEAGATVVKCIHVPGAFDIPIIVSELAEREDIDAIASLGCVIKGETGHDELICKQTARALMDISLQTGVPVTLGVMGPGVTHAQAQARADGYAKRAVEAALRLVDAMNEAGAEKEG